MEPIKFTIVSPDMITILENTEKVTAEVTIGLREFYSYHADFFGAIRTGSIEVKQIIDNKPLILTYVVQEAIVTLTTTNLPSFEKSKTEVDIYAKKAILLDETVSLEFIEEKIKKNEKELQLALGEAYDDTKLFGESKKDYKPILKELENFMKSNFDRLQQNIQFWKVVKKKFLKLNQAKN